MARLVNSRSTPATVPGTGTSIEGGGDKALGARTTETGTDMGGERGASVGAVTGKRVGNFVGGGSGARVGALTGNGVGGGSGARVGAGTGNGVGGGSGAAVVTVTGNGVGGGSGAVTGNGVGGGRGAATGTGAGGGMVVPTGADIGGRTGAGTGAGTVPPLLSIHKPCESKPTQSPINRLEQSKYGRKLVSEIDTTVQLLHKSVTESGSLGLTNISQTHESTERAIPVTQETAMKLSVPKETESPLFRSTVTGFDPLNIHNSYGTPESVS